MKKTTIAFFLIFIVISAYFLIDTNQGRLFLLKLFSKELNILHKHSLSFMEDIKFKDFKSAARYHSPKDQKKVNIPRLIESKFHIKPEFLDILEYKVLDSSIDSTGKRGRVKVKAKVNILNSNNIKQPELIFYFHKNSEKWYMELESSL